VVVNNKGNTRNSFDSIHHRTLLATVKHFFLPTCAVINVLSSHSSMKCTSQYSFKMHDDVAKFIWKLTYANNCLDVNT